MGPKLANRRIAACAGRRTSMSCHAHLVCRTLPTGAAYGTPVVFELYATAQGAARGTQLDLLENPQELYRQLSDHGRRLLNQARFAGATTTGDQEAIALLRNWWKAPSDATGAQAPITRARCPPRTAAFRPGALRSGGGSALSP